MMRLDPELDTWICAITAADLMCDEKALDRRAAIGVLLQNDAVRIAVDSLAPNYSLDIKALGASLSRLADEASVVAKSTLFDAGNYLSQVPQGEYIADPAAHYLLVGERTGLMASRDFSATVYEKFNADVAASSHNRLFHYETWGRQEGRVYRDWLTHHVMPPIVDAADRPTVFLLLHEATYTGAPILGWNLAKCLSEHSNIVVVLRRGGALEQALRDVASVVVDAPPLTAALDPDEMQRFATRLVSAYKPLYVIANSVESRSIAIPIRHNGIPIIALVHEFWPGQIPVMRLDFYACCAALVFPAHLVEQSSFYAFREIRLQNRFVLPQGACAIPFCHASELSRYGAPFAIDDHAPPPLDTLLTEELRGTTPFTVIGLGAVEMRKGIDLFMSAATALRVKHPDIAFRFIWIGSWQHAIGTEHAAFLEEQFKRSGLDDCLFFYPPVDNLEAIYHRADTLFLSSRLDPMPNVAIDAAMRGIPVICFDGASGIAELLATDPDTTSLVVPHLDAGAAADRIAELASDTVQRIACGKSIEQLAQRCFDMPLYAARLNNIGHDAVRKFAQTEPDLRLIEESGAFDASIYFGQDYLAKRTAGSTSAATYLDNTRHINFASSPVFGAIQRRPCPGFHPFIYGTEAPDFPKDGSRDPLAHYLEHRMPKGRWAHRVLRPDLANIDELDVSQTSVALHGHFHYTENIEDFMVALAANRFPADLFLTTTSLESADILHAATTRYRRGSVVVEVLPNVGRDIYPFLHVLREHVQDGYEFIGHLHGKRSVHTMGQDPDFGDKWRGFLWEHLLGASWSTADVIIDAMRQDTQLGLVFPENGHLIGWEKNNESAVRLAERLGRHTALPDYIEFPSGTMFWARVKALNRLVEADFRGEEMPVEPLPIDGTTLHAFERMLPLLCEEAGYAYATTYIPALSN